MNRAAFAPLVASVVACSSGATPPRTGNETHTTPSAAVSTPAAPAKRAPVQIVLGQLPDDPTKYRIVACTIDGAFPAGMVTWDGSTRTDETTPCYRALESAIGQEVDFGGGAHAKLTAFTTVTHRGGRDYPAVTVDPPLGRIATFPVGGAQLMTTLTIDRSANAQSIDVNLDGDGTPDRIALGVLHGHGNKKTADERRAWLSLSGRPFERIEVGELDTLVGVIDLDGDHRDEVVLAHVEEPNGPYNAFAYQYSLWSVTTGKPLADGWHMVAGADYVWAGPDQ